MKRFRYWPEVVLMALWLLAAMIFFGVIWPARTQAAEWRDCEALSHSVETIVKAATGDDDIVQYVQEKSFSHCLLTDELPVQIVFQNLIRPIPLAGTVPAAGPPLDDWALRCAMQYRSFRPSDGTVVRYGSHQRVRCPL